MTNCELALTAQGQENISETIECLITAASEIANASEADFNKIKNKKWYNRLWELITFNKDNQKIQARGVGNLSKLTEIVTKAIVFVSKQSTENSELLDQAIEKIDSNLERIETLTDIQERIVKAIQEIKWGYKKRLTISELSDHKRSAMSAVFFKYIKSLRDDIVGKPFSQKIFSLVYVDSVSTDVNYSILDSFNDDETVLLYRLIQSYYYTATNKLDDESEILDHLKISRKDERTVKADIQDTIKFLGVEYYINSLIAEDNYDYIDDDLIEWIEEFNDLEEEDENQESDFVVFEDITISSMMNITEGETLEYRNKNIKIESLIHCLGTLVFENCNITYNVANTNKNSEIIVENNATLIANNSTFICQSKTKKAFINSKGRSLIYFDHCKFIDCNYFVGSSIKEFTLVNSEMINCGDSFADIYGLYYSDKITCHIEGNIITNEVLQSFNKPNRRENIVLFKIYSISKESSVITNNLVIQHSNFKDGFDADTKVIYFKIDDGIISNCTFKGAENCVDALEVYDCVFKSCTSPVDIQENGKLTNCYFFNCTSSIYAGRYTTISHSKFIGCKSNLLTGSHWGGITVEYCEFIDHINTAERYTKNSIVLERNGDKKSRSNKIKSCIFDGCTLGENYLIATGCFEKPKGFIIYVEDCNFRNIKSKSRDKKIIREHDYYYGLFDRKIDIYAISVCNCVGIEKVNQEDCIATKAVRDAACELEYKIGANLNKQKTTK